MEEIKYNRDDFLKKISPTPIGVVRQLVSAGYDAYIVGGAIRDLLLGHSPKDYDISTSATPEQVRHVFGRRRCRIIGRRFRLAHVFANGELFEVSTFRRKPTVNERQGRKNDSPEIMIWNDNCFGTLEDDAGRRDFTCNSLYLDVARSGQLIDLHNGLSDIRNGIIRCIGNPAERLEEDPVRMLRALKLVALCGFKLEPNLEEAIRCYAQDIKLSSAARLFEELLKIFNSPYADKILQVLHDYGFLRHYWPALDDSWNDQECVLARHLLKLRGNAMRSGAYSDSRGLALSTVCTPFMMTAINPSAPREFWSSSLAMNDTAKRVLEILFEGFMVPKILSYRILDIIGMIPRLLEKPVQSRYLNHKEYRYTRAIVALLVDAFGWERTILNDLPPLSPRMGNFDLETQEEESVDESVVETPASIGEQPVSPAPQAETNGTEPLPTSKTLKRLEQADLAEISTPAVKSKKKRAVKTPRKKRGDVADKSNTQTDTPPQRVTFEYVDEKSSDNVTAVPFFNPDHDSVPEEYNTVEHTELKKKRRRRRSTSAKKKNESIDMGSEQ